MSKITVSRILSEEGLIALKESVTNWTSLEIFETETGKTWENFGGFNGSPKDLWLRKKGTSGATSKTFIRVSVSSYDHINNELRWRDIQSSSQLSELVEIEKMEKKLKVEGGLAAIAAFKDAEKAEKYLSKRAEKNHRQYRTYLGNKCVNLGALREQARDLEKRCREILNR